VDFGLAQECHVEKLKNMIKTSEESTETRSTKRKRSNEVE